MNFQNTKRCLTTFYVLTGMRQYSILFCSNLPLSKVVSLFFRDCHDNLLHTMLTFLKDEVSLFFFAMSLFVYHDCSEYGITNDEMNEHYFYVVQDKARKCLKHEW